MSESISAFLSQLTTPTHSAPSNAITNADRKGR
jgi:hypothetical protein